MLMSITFHFALYSRISSHDNPETPLSLFGASFSSSGLVEEMPRLSAGHAGSSFFMTIFHGAPILPIEGE
jgi:hypothetical protein